MGVSWCRDCGDGDGDDLCFNCEYDLAHREADMRDHLIRDATEIFAEQEAEAEVEVE